MGFGESVETDFYLQYRDQFPVTESLVYLNHAAVAPLCKPAAEAMKGLADDAWRFGSLHYSEWLEAYAGVRKAAARLINSSPQEIAIVKNTSEGIATVALGIDWKPGDRIVCFTGEFPANLLPWHRLSSRGVVVDQLPATSPLERIDKAARGARLLAISFVQYLSGFRADLNSIGDICRRHGCFFFVDAIQGLGAFPLDVEASRIDALAADGHKWLLGPEGCGVFYIRRERMDEVEPAEFGWTNVAGFEGYSRELNMTLRNDAGRYECGTLNTIGCFGLRAALEFILEVGPERIGGKVQALADRIADGATSKGYELLGERTPTTGAGIVSVRKPGLDSRVAVRELRNRQVLAAARQGWVRMSPHFYLGVPDIDTAIAALP
jgi:selenocysteine lyase/cysteine desulfurase